MTISLDLEVRVHRWPSAYWNISFSWLHIMMVLLFYDLIFHFLILAFLACLTAWLSEYKWTKAWYTLCVLRQAIFISLSRNSVICVIFLCFPIVRTSFPERSVFFWLVTLNIFRYFLDFALMPLPGFSQRAIYLGVVSKSEKYTNNGITLKLKKIASLRTANWYTPSQYPVLAGELYKLIGSIEL